jgi:iron-sulfur cluster repair protein YtfE (RIC family)
VDVTRILEADHRQVEDLLSKIERAEGEARTPLIEELATSLKSHMQLEEQVVYPAFQPVVGGEAVEGGTTEHELARKAVADVQRLGPTDPGFGGALDALKAGIEHHVEDEEKDVFPKVRKEGEKVLADVATPFMKKRLELGLPMEAPALAAASTKEELVQEAEQAGVDGAKSMTKDELAEALAGAMSG